MELFVWRDIYSGPTACHSYKSIASQNPELAIIIGPNHFEVGKNTATMIDAMKPLGMVPVDSDSAEKISEISNFIEIDEYSHFQDHSLEVQVQCCKKYFQMIFRFFP